MTPPAAETRAVRLSIALRSVAGTLLDAQDDLGQLTDGPEAPPEQWAVTLDDLHLVVTELADLATAVSDHVRSTDGEETHEMGGGFDALQTAVRALADVAASVAIAQRTLSARPREEPTTA